MSVDTPIVNLGMDYCTGMELTWTSGTLLSVAPGQCRNSTNVNDIKLSSAQVINTAANGAGGLDIGTIANSTLYAVYVIGDSRAYKETSALISADLDEPYLPFGYDMFRRVAYVLTSGAAAILEFRQVGDDLNRWMKYDVGISVLAGGNSAVYAPIDLSASMPSVATDVLLNVAFTPNAAGDTMALRPTGATGAGGYVILSGAAAGVVQQLNQTVPCDEDASVDYKVTALGAATVLLMGYLDAL